MSILSEPAKCVPLLVNGERMVQPEFHRRYEACGEDEKWELIGGVVYGASPLKLPHSDYDDEIGYLLGTYRRATPGTQVTHNATAILGEESEPPPDLGLRILPEYGGQSETTPDGYLKGACELVVEVAHSRRALAMHAKRDDYRRAGVIEYIVLCIEEQELHWFHFASGEMIRPNRQGISRSQVFPGLWLDVAALLRRESQKLVEVLRQGLAGRAHASFVNRLQAVHRRRSSR
ncbi:MAG TPA: Uma2 family endonuclease [Pirellulales bacterium]|nr:Uma2 family endonuclease [Pirellulales bacterium]